MTGVEEILAAVVAGLGSVLGSSGAAAGAGAGAGALAEGAAAAGGLGAGSALTAALPEVSATALPSLTLGTGATALTAPPVAGLDATGFSLGAGKLSVPSLLGGPPEAAGLPWAKAGSDALSMVQMLARQGNQGGSARGGAMSFPPIMGGGARPQTAAMQALSRFKPMPALSLGDGGGDGGADPMTTLLLRLLRGA